jgi:hypothetical protein
MKSVSNKTQRPVSVPLPGGKTLHLGPGKTGHISSKAVEYPPLKKLVDGGEIEVLGEGTEPIDGAGGSKTRMISKHGHSSGGGGRRSGDR